MNQQGLGEFQDTSEFPQWVIQSAKDDTGGALPAGFPYIIDDVSGEVCQVALLYITDRELGRDGKTYNVNTVRAYTADLLDWMRFGSTYGIPWNKATWENLAHYVETMEGDTVSPHHGEPYAPTTISRRLVPIVDLYRWAKDNLEEMTVDAPAGSLFQTKKVADFLDARRKLLRNKIQITKEHIADIEMTSVMLEEEVRNVFAAIGQAPRALTGCEEKAFEEEESSGSSVGHLGMNIGLQAGLRVSEVLGLQVRLFERFHNIAIVPNRYYSIGPFRRKGGKGKKVLFHGVLLQEVMNYIACERKFVMRACAVDHGRLMVHKHGRFKGLPLQKSALQRRFANACLAAGVMRKVTKSKPVDGDWSNVEQEEQERAKYTFHDLRHTFAVWNYYARKAAGDAEPWKFIQEQLGHEDVSTTIKIYLRVTHDFEAFISDGFIDTLDRTAGVTVDEGEVV